MSNSNPKTLMGRAKIPMISVIPAASLIHQAHAMRYGAFEALKKDGTRGYGPYNWRDQKIEAGIYVDAAMRHILQWYEGEEAAEDSQVHHLGHALATLGILLDAMENDTMIDDRPRVRSGAATKLFARLKELHAKGIEERVPMAAPDLAQVDADAAEARAMLGVAGYPSPRCTVCEQQPCKCIKHG